MKKNELFSFFIGQSKRMGAEIQSHFVSDCYYYCLFFSSFLLFFAFSVFCFSPTWTENRNFFFLDRKISTERKKRETNGLALETKFESDFPIFCFLLFLCTRGHFQEIIFPIFLVCFSTRLVIVNCFYLRCSRSMFANFSSVSLFVFYSSSSLRNLCNSINCVTQTLTKEREKKRRKEKRGQSLLVLNQSVFLNQ